jgi:hypothetical protein
MHPYHFVAILGSDSERGWAVLTGRSDGLASRGGCQNGHLRLSPAHFFGTAMGRARQKNRRKEGSNEKGRDCSRSSSGGSSLGTWRSPMAEALTASKYFMKEEKQ